MGVIINSIHKGSSITQGILSDNSTSTAIQKMQSNSSFAIDQGSKACPIASQLREINLGITQGDLEKVMFNGGVLALYTIPIGSAGNKGFQLYANTGCSQALNANIATGLMLSNSLSANNSNGGKSLEKQGVQQTESQRHYTNSSTSNTSKNAGDFGLGKEAGKQEGKYEWEEKKPTKEKGKKKKKTMVFKYPSKHLQMSSSVILIRPHKSQYGGQLDYQVLMLKRNPDIRFGNFFAFPGGMIEKQDYPDVWEKNMPFYYDKYLEGGVKTFPDFAKRMAAVRELFEETNLFMQNMFYQEEKRLRHESLKSMPHYKIPFEGKYKGSFAEFCKGKNYYPAIDKLSAFFRLGGPVGFYPAQDTQFYIYFCDDQLKDQDIYLNEGEFTEHKWISIKDLLNQYQEGEIPMAYPQVLILTKLLFLNKGYDDLKSCLHNGFQQNILNYVSNRPHFFDFQTLMKDHGQDEDYAIKEIKKIFDESDLNGDDERSEIMHVWNNDKLMEQYPLLGTLKVDKKGAMQTLIEVLLRHDVIVGIFYPDFYSTQDNYPFGVNNPTQRYRFFIHKTTRKLLRVEISKSFLAAQSSPFPNPTSQFFGHGLTGKTEDPQPKL